MSLLDRWKRGRKHFRSPGDAGLFLGILGLALVLPLLLWALSVRRLLALLTPRVPVGLVVPEPQVAKIATFTDDILGWNVWPLRRKCLVRALVLYRFLRRAGLDVHMCLGVRPAASHGRVDDLQGHAWLLHEGRPFLESDEAATQTFTVTYCSTSRPA